MKNTIKIAIPNNAFRLADTFKSGQIFRWRETEKGFAGFIKNAPALITQLPDGVVCQTDYDISEQQLSEFLGLDLDYDSIFNAYSDEVIKQAYEKYRGLTILKQEPLECAISFITSANNNIKRINKHMDALSKLCGRAYEFNGQTLYAFPELSELQRLTEADFAALGFGYRAAYIAAFIKRVKDEYPLFLSLRSSDYASAKEYLLSFKGIGNKVADCILLYGFRHYEAFPVDVWIKRALNELYGFSEKNAQKINEFAAQKFPNYAGIAQLYLFMLMRMGGSGQ